MSEDAPGYAGKIKVREKVPTITAEQFWPDRRPWPDGVGGPSPMFVAQAVYTFSCLGGFPVAIDPGDWIIGKDTGQYFVISDYQFRLLYEPI